jgi:hypothetical protein
MEISTTTGGEGEFAEVDWGEREPEPERDFRLNSMRADTGGVSSASGVDALENGEDDGELLGDDKGIAG